MKIIIKKKLLIDKAIQEAVSVGSRKKELTDSDKKLLSFLDEKDLKTNPEIKFLLKAGYIPVQQHGDPLLGEGAYGKVFQATKAGTDKLYAVKVISPNDNELQVRKKIESIRERLPPEISKHFVKCYEIKKINLADKMLDDNVAYIVVMQLVRPMSSIEETVLYKGISSLDKFLLTFYVYKKLTDWDIFAPLFQKTLERIFDETEDEDAAETSRISTYIKEEISKKLLTLEQDYADICSSVEQIAKSDKKITPNSAKIASIVEKFCRVLVDCVFDDERAAKKLRAVKGIGSREELFDLFINKGSIVKKMFAVAADQFKKEKNKETFASRGKQKEFKMTTSFADFITNYLSWEVGFDREKIKQLVDGMQNISENAKSFLKALIYMATQEGIMWKDLHIGNVMVNPQTRDYLAVDIGLFNLTR